VENLKRIKQATITWAHEKRNREDRELSVDFLMTKISKLIFCHTLSNLEIIVLHEL
jgi:hypothetical protein